jgi:hypothetical protein
METRRHTTTQPPKLSQVTLSDHRVVDVRPLEQRDREDLSDAISRLSPQTRYLRFANAKPHMTSRELDFLVDVGRPEHRALLAVDPVTGWGVAVVRYVALPRRPSQMTGRVTGWAPRWSCS